LNGRDLIIAVLLDTVSASEKKKGAYKRDLGEVGLLHKELPFFFLFSSSAYFDLLVKSPLIIKS